MAISQDVKDQVAKLLDNLNIGAKKVELGQQILALIDEAASSGGGGGAAVTVDTLTGATTTGKSLMKAANAAGARTAIGAGEPYTLPAAGADIGGVKQAAAVADATAGADAAALVTKVNALLAALRTSGALAQ